MVTWINHNFAVAFALLSHTINCRLHKASVQSKAQMRAARPTNIRNNCFCHFRCSSTSNTKATKTLNFNLYYSFVCAFVKEWNLDSTTRKGEALTRLLWINSFENMRMTSSYSPFDFYCLFDTTGTAKKSNVFNQFLWNAPFNTSGEMNNSRSARWL